MMNMSASQNYAVMAGLVPAIHVLAAVGQDGRDEPGHDEVDGCVP
jgi:hypothetical protein